MKFRYLFALTLILLVLAMASTNPNKEDFIIWAKDIAIEKMAENYFFGDASSETINYMIGDILTFILDNHTETNNYILFSIHNFEVESDKVKLKLKTLGALNDFILLDIEPKALVSSLN